MDPFFAALLVTATAVMGTGGVAAVVGSVAKGRIKAQRGAAWTVAARELGLSYVDERIFGRRHGQNVLAYTLRRNRGDDAYDVTVLASRLDVPLDLGLSLSQLSYQDPYGIAADIPLGEPPFDRRFLVRGDEAERVRDALSPRLRTLLMARVGDTTFHLSDTGMFIEVRGRPTNVHWIIDAIELCSRATRQLDRSRRLVRCAAPLVEHRRAWARFATAVGLHSSSTPLAMWGELHGTAVHVFAVRRDPLRYELEVRADFPTPLNLGLLVKPRGMVERLTTFFGSRDVAFDDPAFDDTFVVQGAAAEVTALLDATARQQLVALHHDFGPVLVSDDGVSLRRPTVPRDPAGVPRLVQRMAAIAERLAPRRDAQAGPYR
jgi:hypothetical protein